MNAGREGFTLIEIMIALAILAMSIFILLETHSAAMRQFQYASDEVDTRALLELALGYAEVGIATGELGGEQEFSKRNPGYRMSYTAELIDEQVPMYNVLVTVAGPDNERHEFGVLTYVVSDEAPAPTSGGAGEN